MLCLSLYLALCVCVEGDGACMVCARARLHAHSILDAIHIKKEINNDLK